MQKKNDRLGALARFGIHLLDVGSCLLRWKERTKPVLLERITKCLHTSLCSMCVYKYSDVYMLYIISSVYVDNPMTTGTFPLCLLQALGAPNCHFSNDEFH